MQLLDAKRIFDAFLDERSEDIEHAIHELWKSRDEGTWHKEPYFYVKLGEIADKLGQVMFAHDVLQEGLHFFPDHVRLTQLFALALIKCGFISRAKELLSGLVEKGHKDEETLGILGRVYKDMWLLSGENLENSEFLRQSRDLYLEAFKRNKGYYSGINAASMSLMLGDFELTEKTGQGGSETVHRPHERDKGAGLLGACNAWRRISPAKKLQRGDAVLQPRKEEGREERLLPGEHKKTAETSQQVYGCTGRGTWNT